MEYFLLEFAITGKCGISLGVVFFLLKTRQILWYQNTVKILKFGTPQTIAIILLKIEKFDVTLQ